jgi:hypothetical protein
MQPAADSRIEKAGKAQHAIKEIFVMIFGF